MGKTTTTTTKNNPDNVRENRLVGAMSLQEQTKVTSPQCPVGLTLEAGTVHHYWGSSA